MLPRISRVVVHLLPFAVVLAIGSHATSAEAAPTVLQFQSIVSSIYDVIPGPEGGPAITTTSLSALPGTTIDLNDTFSGMLSYDPALTTVDLTFTNFIRYNIPLTLNMTITTASETIPLSFAGTGTATLNLNGGTAIQTFILEQMNVAPLAGAAATTASFVATGLFPPFNPGDPFALPTSVTDDGSCCNSNTLGLTIHDGSSMWSGTGPEFSVNSEVVSVVTLPEPSLALLVGFGLLSTLRRRR